MLTKTLKQSKISLASEGMDFLFCRQKPFSMREEIPFLHLHAERGLFVLGVEMKKCSKCKEVKPLTEFHRDKSNKDKYHFSCKECCSYKYKRYLANIKKKFNGLYGVWRDMKNRCFNSNNKSFNRYGGRGITVCQEWKDSFQVFYKWAKEKHKKGLQIDRRNNNGNYCPDNCRFVTRIENVRNSFTAKLNIEKVRKVKHLLKEKKLIHKKIGIIFNVNRSAISHINVERNWRNIYG